MPSEGLQSSPTTGEGIGSSFDDDYDYYEDDCDELAWYELIQAEIEKLEGFKVCFEPWGTIGIFHYGTEIGVILPNSSLSTTLINELAKYGLDLEAFFIENCISFNLIQLPKPITTPDYSIQWEDTLHPNEGRIDAHFFSYATNSYHGDHIQLIHKNRPYCSHWANLPEYIQSMFKALWQEIKDKEIYPKSTSVGSRVASLLPDGYKAFRVGDRTQCKVAKNKQDYCYIKDFGNNTFYVSANTNYNLAPTHTASTLQAATTAAIGMIQSL